MPKIKHIDVCCAIIIKDTKVLAAQRRQEGIRGGMWEFPGGKIEKGEAAEQCIKREIIEELGMNINIIEKLDIVNHCYHDIHIRLIPFVTTPLTDIVYLTSHEKADFFCVSELLNLKWSDADLLVLTLWLSGKRH